MPADRLNEVGVLRRREIEARIVAPLLEALAREFDRDGVLNVARDVIIRIAKEQGAQLAEAAGGRTLAHFASSLDLWKRDGALEIDVLEQTEDQFSFNVTRCRYAELYRALGIPELGAILSCNRDFSLIEGFNSHVQLTRTQTIMEGAVFCDFRYVRNPNRPASGGAKPRADGREVQDCAT
ncbi:MAG: L-2-amino-thiazoline-4-carboxylic acid hydrolase [Candidatus Methylomirabilia bacterium]